MQINLFAHVRGIAGTSIAARGTLLALEAAGVEVIVCDPSGAEGSLRPSDAPDAINLIHVNPHHFKSCLDHVRAGPSGSRPLVAFWVFDVPGVSFHWKGCVPLIDEIWVPSSFVAEIVHSELSTPVVVIPHPVRPPDVHLDRAALGLPSDPFVFLFAFNARSNMARKNPTGLIRAYRSAFPVEDDTLLVLKSIQMREDERTRLEHLIDGRRDILLCDGIVEEDRMAALTAACDCYVSLHRTEGFGLGMAEAMYLGRPVIATGYAGNLDFMSEATGFLVRHSMTHLERGVGVFAPGTIWAQPEIADAARLMRHVARHRDEAKEIGRRASVHVRGLLAPERVGRMMRERLIDLLQVARDTPMVEI